MQHVVASDIRRACFRIAGLIVDEQFHRCRVKLNMHNIQNLTSCRRRYFHVLLCLAGAGLGGCATDMQLAQSHVHVPLKVMVIQSPLSVAPDRLQKVFAPNSKKKLSISDQPIAQYVQHSRKHAMTTLVADLRKQHDFKLVSPPAAEQLLVKKLQDRPYAVAIPQKTADHIHASTDADALLKFHITDYGLTPKSWRTGYITFEVVTTLAIAAAIANIGTTAAKGAAETYLAQETVEETAESYAGFWALDVVSRPVRIEAELVQLEPVDVLWQYGDTGLSDVRFSRLFRKVGTAERDKQLDQSTDYAINDVVSDLVSALDHLKSPAKHHFIPRDLKLH